MLLNVIKSYRDVVAICDKELLGKKFEEPSDSNPDVIRQLDIKESFYKGKEASEEEIINTIKAFAAEDATFNIVGQKAVACALKSGLVSEDNVDKIKEIPFVLVLV